MWSLRAWRRQRILRRHPLPELPWLALIDTTPLLRRLADDERRRLRELATLLLHTKAVTGANGLVPTPDMQLRVAALAALPILGLDTDWYANWHEVVLYPDAFVQQHEWMDEASVVHEERRELDGESWLQGPVVLAWPEVVTGGQGRNLVVHEIAHKLDMLDGDANGRPPLHRDMDPAAWHEAFSRAYAAMVEEVDSGRATRIDPYAADAPEEFFAVTSEAFFETPCLLQAAFPAVYAQLRLFYRQDPLRRFTC